MSAATQSIRSSPLPPSILRYDTIASSSSESPRHVAPREQPLQLGRLDTGALRNAWNDERNRHLLIGHRACYRCKWRIEIVSTPTLPSPLLTPRWNSRTLRSQKATLSSSSTLPVPTAPLHNAVAAPLPNPAAPPGATSGRADPR